MASALDLFMGPQGLSRTLFRLSLDIWRFCKFGVIVTTAGLGISLERKGARWALALGRVL